MTAGAWMLESILERLAESETERDSHEDDLTRLEAEIIDLNACIDSLRNELAATEED